jgi:hypothetical protein
MASLHASDDAHVDAPADYSMLAHCDKRAFWSEKGGGSSPLPRLRSFRRSSLHCLSFCCRAGYITPSFAIRWSLCVTTLLLILLVAVVGLIAFFWAGTFFFQGYIYTEPTSGLAWQAPAAGAAVGAFVAVWCLCVASSSDASPTDIPYDTLFRFSPKVSMFLRPAPKLTAIKQDGKRIEYVCKRLDQTRYRYVDTAYEPRPWNSTKVKAIELDYQGQKVVFNMRPVTDAGMYREFVSDDGWVMLDYDDSSQTAGPTGMPSQFRTGRFILNLFFNFGLLVVVFLSLWLLLRYQWPHALGLAFVIWLVCVLTVLPMLLSYAAGVAAQR